MECKNLNKNDLIMGFYRGPNAITSGLILSLDAGNTKSYQSGSTTWFDKSGKANNGTLTNGPTFSSANGGSIVFDGVDDFVSTVQSLTSLSFSYEAFLIPTNVSKDQMYIGTSIAAFYIRILGSKAFLSITAGGIQRIFTHDTILENNKVYHIVSIYNGVQLKIYINTVLAVGTVLNEPLQTPWGTERIGRWRDVDQRSFVGSIYTVRLYNRELSQDEVTQNYNATKSRFNL